MRFDIRSLSRSDCDALVRHMRDHADESGRGKGLVFLPRARGDRLDVDKLRASLLAGLGTPLQEPGWLRAWGAFTIGDERAELIGHVDLRARPEPASRHRAWLGIGVREPHRKKGVGRALLDHALTWARQQPALTWVDLSVFAHNQVAHRLYERLGFREVGRVPDLFRIDGQTVEDITMTLPLR